MSRKPTNSNSLFAGEAEGPGTSLALVPGLRPDGGGLPPQEPLLLRPIEAARLLGIGPSKLFEMLARQELPVVRIGRCVRIPRQELAQWVNQSIDLETAARNAFLGVGFIQTNADVGDSRRSVAFFAQASTGAPRR
ncbi:MAG TPA: helix-turn-helix domain-containing protein [Candidatus Dormibacteraeota bacterium]|jgi:excisionase family DNA binding protein|nr:helix-turn-helix domain-containing protein [Candidatus Dormibacteraeota bacterium]